jgi:HlyD family secretion protein
MSLLRGCLLAARKAVLGLAVVGLLGGAAWGIWHWRAAGERQVHFRTDKVTRGRVAALINATGTVVPEEVVDVGAQVAGRIVSFGPDLDDSGKTIDYRARVEEGTVLARIDESLYAPEVGIAKAELAVAEAEVLRCRADLTAARTRLTQATRDLQRARRSGAGVAAMELDALTAAHETASAAVPGAEAALLKAEKTVLRAKETLKKAETNLGYCTIKSPVKGVIIDRRVNIGQTVVASLNAPSLFLIARDLKRMQVWASVNEADIGRIHVGLPAAFRVDAYPDEVFAGVVTQIRLNASMTQNVVTYTVVVSTENEKLKLLPYLTANLQFRVGQRDDVLLVSNAALRYRPAPERVAAEFLTDYLEMRRRKPAVSELRPGKQASDAVGLVWIEEDGQLRPIRVRLGLSDGTVTELLEVLDDEEHLETGDRLVTGEQQEQAAGGSNPFAVKMWTKKKE